MPVQAKLAQLRAHAEEMLQGVLQNPKLSSTELAQLAEHERCACVAASRQGHMHSAPVPCALNGRILHAPRHPP